MNPDATHPEDSGPSTSGPLVGRAYWRSLEDLADSVGPPDEQFPTLAADLMRRAAVVDRRRFLELMAASIGLAGLAGCRRPDAKILPYAQLPESVVPGLPTYYASALPRRGTALPILVESHEGRPTKVEGNPNDPEGAGALDAQAQASILDLYDPDRSRAVLRRQGATVEEMTWEAFDTFAEGHFAGLRSARGRGLRWLSGEDTSASLEGLRDQARQVFPEARWHVYEPINDNQARAGAALAFGEAVVPRYQLDRARVILALDADCLGVEGDGVRHIRGFSQVRRVEQAGDPMNRLYVVEPHYTVTGGMADHRLRLPASQVQAYAEALFRALLLAEEHADEAARGRSPKLDVDDRWIQEVAADLREHRGESLIIAGRRQPAIVHALAHAMNALLENLGKTVTFRPPRDRKAGTLAELAEAIQGGQVETLVILGGNPAFDAPAVLDFANLLTKVPHTIHLGSHVDETSSRSAWSLPAAHFLESWGDARTADGRLLPIQPLIEPLFGGRTALELVARLNGSETTTPFEIVRGTFRRLAGEAEAEFEAHWRRFLHDGLGPEAVGEPVQPSLRWDEVARALSTAPPASSAPGAEDLELVFVADSKLDDGRHANNGWLQEAPDPVTKLTWDNAALISPGTAHTLGVATGDLVRLDQGGRSVEIAAFVLPGSADHSVSVALGYGRTEVGRVGRDAGVNVYPLRPDASDITRGLRVSRTGRAYPLAMTQDHFRMEGRDLVRELDRTESWEHSRDGHDEKAHPDIQVRPSFDGEHQWGMAIDLNTCVGCNACTIACQAENNIPIVGKDEVIRGREMHWIRIDRYFAGDPEDPGMVHQPIPCMHCENAPCEVVCPVNATVHNNEGLNLQIYNRCIGTRYCSNNCPYKVRRFNFFDYNQRPLDQLRLGPAAPKGMAETLQMQKNPDVTVRIRRVMEKCTYCVQRIERARIGARVAAGESADVRVPDGTIVPACAQTCPTEAIVFGDVSDPDSRVSRIKRQDRDYALLGELNTKPRTTYQARLRNPNPRMPAGGGLDVNKGGQA
ncbi:MAG: 4Fe-4S dicluster domain-containing protein [Isosphaeraceae bacterium]